MEPIHPDVSKPITSKSEAIEIMRNNPINFKFMSDELRNDKDVILASCKSSGEPPLKYASDELKDNLCVVRRCMDLNFNSIDYASDRVRSLIYEVPDIKTFKLSSIPKRRRTNRSRE